MEGCGLIVRKLSDFGGRLKCQMPHVLMPLEHSVPGLLKHTGLDLGDGTQPCPPLEVDAGNRKNADITQAVALISFSEPDAMSFGTAEH